MTQEPEATPHVSKATSLLPREYKRSFPSDGPSAFSCNTDPSLGLQEP